MEPLRPAPAAPVDRVTRKGNDSQGRSRERKPLQKAVAAGQESLEQGVEGQDIESQTEHQLDEQA